ncbi:hypothetical protein CPC08DRAFT_413077 [Agrocybe pediades]|nr:hypothetical protein CPC08DRAFT_413077 [Agrocybe pediades]
MSIQRSDEVSIACEGEVGWIVVKGTESNNSHVSRPRYGMRITSTTYFEKVKNIGARWRRTDLDSCGSGDMLWLDVIDVLKAGLDKLPYKYHRRVNFLPFL